jgi:parallel beta-helix repeat protein
MTSGSQLKYKLSGHLLVAVVAGFLSSSACAQTTSIQLSPGQNIQSAVNAAPAGTTFELAAGVYRMQSIVPRNGDVFIGQGTVVLNGSQVLSFAPSTATTWVASAPVTLPFFGYCLSGSPLCGYDQDLFVDGALQVPVSSPTGLTPGTWYFDRVNQEAYIAVNPSGHTIELGMTEFAFSGIANGVVVENITVQEYANPAQTGAVGGYKDGTDWVVSQVTAQENHGTGISLGPGGQILNCTSTYNGQMGIAIVEGSNSKVIGNTISWNNYAGYDRNWEAGGSKFWATTGLLVQGNYVHDNNGPGLWTDFDNVGTVYYDNTVVNNYGPGIIHEISYNAAIYDNAVEGNGTGPNSILWNAQILLANSQNVQVYGNRVVVSSGNGDGIGMINQERGTGSLGEWVAANNYIHNNTVTYQGTNGSSGLVDYLGGNTAVGNRMDSDSYTLPSGGTAHWVWFSRMTWSQLQAAGEETHGSVTQ